MKIIVAIILALSLTGCLCTNQSGDSVICGECSDVCSTGKACGDSCIASDDYCYHDDGGACDAY